MKYVFWNVGSFLGPFFLALETVYLGSQGKAGGDVDGLTIAQVMNLHLRGPQSSMCFREASIFNCFQKASIYAFNELSPWPIQCNRMVLPWWDCRNTETSWISPKPTKQGSTEIR